MHQVHRVARELRQFKYAPLVDHLAERGLGGGEQWRRAGDFNRLRHAAHGEIHVYFHAVVDANLNPRTDPLLKPGHLHRQGVSARNQIGQYKIAACVRLGRGHDAGILVCNADFRIRNHRSALVGNSPEHGAARVLGGCLCHVCGQINQDRDECYQDPLR